MLVHVVGVCVVLVLAMAWVTPIGAAQLQFPQPPSAPRVQPQPPQAQPFQLPRPRQQPQPSFPPPTLELGPAATPAKPRVVCGMTLIPADPATDPKIAKPGPETKRDGTKFTIRAVQPSICW